RGAVSSRNSAPRRTNRHEIDQTPPATLVVVQRCEPCRFAGTAAFAFGIRALETADASRGLRQVHALRAATSVHARAAAQISILTTITRSSRMEVIVNGATRIGDAPAADIAALIRPLRPERQRMAVECTC